jgi:curved DNA-binding protein CbpA
MSKPLVSVNFQNLKYNLYEILGVTRETSEKKIKKMYLKLAAELHPDNNPEFNEELWNHVVIANQVLTNLIEKKKYNDYLDNKDNKESFADLKNNFEYDVKEIEKMFPKKEEAKSSFKDKIEELNKKHGFNKDLDSMNIMANYEKLKKNRGDVAIQQEKILNNDDFNSKFQKRKETGGFQDQVINYSNNSSLIAYESNDGLMNIGDYSALYAEDTISTSGFTSLNQAFKIQNINTKVPEKSLEQRMKEYNNATSMFDSRKPGDFSQKKFDEWTEK